ncbi:unnamed protein product [Symbiodinium natans]|uniref:Uncharacterized protein n=1 Tax=Symbiodinium natans TaxID=878477 RepID=A0A812L9I1_9DINO|nr:unnamed protein product [Symbiodinium natans]
MAVAAPSASQQGLHEEAHQNILSPEMASILGECLTEVLKELQNQVPPDEQVHILDAFNKAWAKEIAKLPRLWRVSLRGRLQSFSFAGQDQFVDIRDAEVQTPDFTYAGLPVRIQGKLKEGGARRKKRRVVDSEED